MLYISDNGFKLLEGDIIKDKNTEKIINKTSNEGKGEEKGESLKDGKGEKPEKEGKGKAPKDGKGETPKDGKGNKSGKDEEKGDLKDKKEGDSDKKEDESDIKDKIFSKNLKVSDNGTSSYRREMLNHGQWTDGVVPYQYKRGFRKSSTYYDIVTLCK